LGVPEKIIQKPPTPDLVPGVTDEEAFGLKYFEIDEILMKLAAGEEINTEKARRVKELMKLAKYRELKSLGIEDEQTAR